MIKYIVVFLLSVILMLGVTTWYFKSKATELELQNKNLQGSLESVQTSLDLEKSRSKILEDSYAQVQKNLEELKNSPKVVKSEKVIVKNCIVEIKDLNKSTGIPKYLGNIGK